MPDIDIDFADRNLILQKIEHRIAKLPNGKKHNTGIYITEIPHNPVNNISTINYKDADNRKYFKLDILNVSLYKDIKDENHLEQLMKKEPLWELLEYKEFVDKLFHLQGHYDICSVIKPKSVEELAIVLALIRPAKKDLIVESKDIILNKIWQKPTNGEYYFKKAHAVSYAMAIVVQMNLICETLKNT